MSWTCKRSGKIFKSACLGRYGIEFHSPVLEVEVKIEMPRNRS